jgi:uncharacterized protein YjbJ (UPF0337 family)
MNKGQFLGKWLEMRGKVKQRWSKLTDDDLDQVNYKMLVDRIQQQYGERREDIENQLDTMMAT